MKAKHLRIAGRVQGVGYRDWLVHEARSRGLLGWVRNAGADVEAVLYGETDAVEELERLCRLGPRGARVTDVTDTLTDPPDQDEFSRLPSVR